MKKALIFVFLLGVMSQAAFARIEKMSLGMLHSCAIDHDLRVKCWGGQIDGRPFNVPEAAQRAIDISSRDFHTCAITPEFKVVCWGMYPVPADAELSSEITFRSIALGSYHRCGIRADDHTVYCWGDNSRRQLNSPKNFRASMIASGSDHSCAINKDNHLLNCWGFNERGQSRIPMSLIFKQFSSVSLGSDFSCGIGLSNHRLYCWGSNEHRQLEIPRYVELEPILSLATGSHHVCVVLERNHQLHCWGFNDSGQANPPSILSDAVFAGGDHSCAVTQEGPVNCWGYNAHNQATVPRRLERAGTWPVR